MRVWILAFGTFFAAAGTSVQAGDPLTQVQTIPLPGVEGRIDHMAVDVQGQRLLIAALGNHSVEVVGLKEGRRIASLDGLQEPQGVLFALEFHKLFVANRANGMVTVFEGDPFKRVGELDLHEDADNLRYDSATRQVYVGYADGALGVIDPESNKQTASIPLPGHPESFRLEKSGPRIFINIPGGRVAVVDRSQGRVIQTWTAGALLKANYPMALDEEQHRLFVGYRAPTRLVVFDTDTGRVVAKLESAGDADDIFYDSARRRVYISGGEGVIVVVAQQNADQYHVIAKIPTARGARTSFFVPETHRFYLAVPHRGEQQAEIRVYTVQS